MIKKKLSCYTNLFKLKKKLLTLDYHFCPKDIYYVEISNLKKYKKSFSSL